MASTFIKKAGAEFVSTFVKAIGSESGKRVVNGKPKKEGVSCLDKVRAVKESVTMIDHKYSWEDIDYNAYKVAEYVRILAPIAGATAVCWFCLPVFAGATSFAIVGTGAATLTYGITNVAVVVGGASKAAKKIIDYQHHCNQENQENDNELLEDNCEVDANHCC